MLSVFPYPNLKEFKIFKKINTPIKIQDFLDKMPMNFEKQGDTIRSPLFVLRKKQAHCIEGAMLAAAILWYHNEKPLLLDLGTTDEDFDHVVAPFKRKNYWGAISKTNHAVLRYRDPVYKSVRELAMSYFNEYFLDNRKKSMRNYSVPLDLRKFGKDWLISEKNQWHIERALYNIKHFKILRPGMAKWLRLADKFELKADSITEWPEK